MTDKEKVRYKDVQLAHKALILYYPFGIDNLDGEEWRDIERYEGHYQISNYSRIKSFKNDKITILKPLIDKNGYLQIVFSKNGQHKWFKLHRLVAQAFIPNPENKPQVNHIDGNKMNNHVSNLEWVSQSENNNHAVNTGLRKSGGDHPQSHLTNEEAVWCRSVYIPRDKEFGASALARKFGVNSRTMRYILSGKTYKKICPNAEILQGLAIHGADAKNSESQVAAWAKKVI